MELFRRRADAALVDDGFEKLQCGEIHSSRIKMD
jgi:hypothetical protein